MERQGGIYDYLPPAPSTIVNDTRSFSIDLENYVCFDILSQKFFFHTKMLF
jgi:hypothetical protein